MAKVSGAGEGIGTALYYYAGRERERYLRFFCGRKHEILELSDLTN